LLDLSGPTFKAVNGKGRKEREWEEGRREEDKVREGREWMKARDNYCCPKHT